MLPVYTKNKSDSRPLLQNPKYPIVHCQSPIAMIEMVQTGVTHAMVTGLMKDMYHEWKCIPMEEYTWNSGKITLTMYLMS